SELEKRKAEHVQIVAKKDGMDRKKYYFDEIRLTHRALPEIDLKAVDPSVEFLGKPLSFPLLISSMTGGGDKLFRTINTNLAAAAEAEGVAMGVGSQRIFFTEATARSSFDLRHVAPTALLFSNLGAVQLNNDMTLNHARAVVQVLKADALCLHLNPLQEAVQPEGDTNFSSLRKKIGEIVQGLEVPVIVKEVGAGISAADAALLIEAGVKYIDVAGTGGTSWSRIEGERSDDSSLGELFQDWGLPTPYALKALAPLDVTLIASGGIRSGVDMVKAMILGASLCGAGCLFLAPAMESADAVRKVIQRLKREFVTAMFLLGCKNIEQLRNAEHLIETGAVNLPLI
ncbi:MAG: type 2 isopentenyl-diphosphate Delta-isomerase, partial [Pontiellaceae bacterium]|nr:type 2 isopentenyl-diphosphate Delta-isomerase [Pontiellaceae bacterium]